MQLIKTNEYPPPRLARQPWASPSGDCRAGLHGGQVEWQNKKPQNDEVITAIFENVDRFSSAK